MKDKNRNLLVNNRVHMTSMFESQRKRRKIAKHKDLETAVLIWFKQARSQNVSISGSLLLAKADELAK